MLRLKETFVADVLKASRWRKPLDQVETLADLLHLPIAAGDLDTVVVHFETLKRAAETLAVAPAEALRHQPAHRFRPDEV